MLRDDRSRAVTGATFKETNMHPSRKSFCLHILPIFPTRAQRSCLGAAARRRVAFRVQQENILQHFMSHRA